MRKCMTEEYKFRSILNYYEYNLIDLLINMDIIGDIKYNKYGDSISIVTLSNYLVEIESMRCMIYELLDWLSHKRTNSIGEYIPHDKCYDGLYTEVVYLSNIIDYILDRSFIENDRNRSTIILDTDVIHNFISLIDKVLDDPLNYKSVLITNKNKMTIKNFIESIGYKIPNTYEFVDYDKYTSILNHTNK